VKSIACVLVVLPLYAQAVEENPLKELVAEIRALRLAVERSSLLTTRTQVLVQRFAVQQGRADRLKAELGNAASAVLKMQAEQAHTLELMKRSEMQIQSASVPQDKKESLAHEAGAYKRRLADQASRDSQLRAVEAQLAGEHRAALSRIAELEEQLTRIEREPGAVTK
jgi:hypothetical protein